MREKEKGGMGGELSKRIIGKGECVSGRKKEVLSMERWFLTGDEAWC